MKEYINKLITLYNNNVKFHSLVSGVEGAVIGALVSYSNGLPSSKTGWVTLGSTLGNAAWGALRKWLTSGQ